MRACSAGNSDDHTVSNPFRAVTKSLESASGCSWAAAATAYATISGVRARRLISWTTAFSTMSAGNQCGAVSASAARPPADDVH